MATNEKFILEFATKGVENIDRAMGKIDGLSSKINTLATTILGVSFANFIAGALEAADRISDFSDATNISIGSLVAFQGALDESGGKAKNMEKIINGLYAAIDSANQGSLAARDAFKAVGVSLDDLKSLDESQILNKTLKGLSEMPAGAERSAIATQLLSRAFRGVDPKAFWEALDSGKMDAYAESIKKAADQQQQLEKAYKNLQLGALQALEPILKMLGEHNLTVEAGAKIVTILGATLALAFGASLLANILKINQALGITAALSNVIGKGPVGIIAKLVGSAVGVAAVTGELDAILEKNKAIEESAKKAGTAEAAITGGDKINQAIPSTGNANRQQGLDARQQAEIESNKRIAMAIADTRKEIALRTASDLEKIDVTAETELQRAKEEIYSKQNLSRQQKEKEYAAVAKAINEKSTTEFVALQRQQQAEIAQQKAGYAAQNLQLLGQEYTETQRVTDLIAQQPQKYKEIGQEMIKNASLQDAEKRRVEEIVRLRAVERDTFKLVGDYVFNITSMYDEQQKRVDQINASTQLQKDIIGITADAEKRKIELLKATPGYYEAMMVQQGRSGELTKQQIQDAQSYLNKQEQIVKGVYLEAEAKVALAKQEDALRKDFNVGWKGAYDKYVEDSKNASDQAKTYFETFSKGFEDAIVTFVQTGKLSFKDLANSIIADFARIQAKKLLVGLMDMGGGGGLLGGIGKIFGFANGGEPPIGVPSLVGERGPELFIPRQAGTIVPNEQLGLGGNQTSVVYNINAVDAASFQQLLARDPSFLYAVSEKGRRSLPQGAMR